MKILSYVTHETYQSMLAKTKDQYFLLPSQERPQGWMQSWRSVPSNVFLHQTLTERDGKYYIVTPSCGPEPYLVDVSDFDLLLTQSQNQYFHSLPWWKGPHLHFEHTCSPGLWPFPVGGDIIFGGEFGKKSWKFKPEAKIRIIRLAVDTNEWKSNSGHDAKVLTVVDRFKTRDWCTGYEMFRHVTRDLPTVIKGTNNSDIDPSIQGSKDLYEVKDWYFKYQIYFNSAIFTTGPYTVLEAMASKMPVVSTITGEIPNLIGDPEKPNLLASNDPAQLRKYLKQLLESKDLRTEIGERGYEVVKKEYNPERFISEWKEMFQRVVKKG